MLDMLNNNKEELGVLATDFSEIIAGTEVLLANSASVTVIDKQQTTEALEFSLRIKAIQDINFRLLTRRVVSFYM